MTDLPYEVVPDKVFVFGSNLLGIHKSGAAKFALIYHGAEYGQGEGRQGNSYALPTKDTPWVSLSLDDIKKHVDTFIAYAKANPNEQFLVTRVGCGLAGYTDADMAPLFRHTPDNCELSEKWYKIQEEAIEIVYVEE